MKVYKHDWYNFTAIPNEIFRHDLSLKAIGMYTYIVNKPEGWDFSIAGTATQLKDGKDSVRSAVVELEEKGFLVRRQTRFPDGSFGDSIWYIYQTPAENPTTGNPTSEKPTQVILQEDKKKEVCSTRVTRDEQERTNNFVEERRVVSPHSSGYSKSAQTYKAGRKQKQPFRPFGYAPKPTNPVEEEKTVEDSLVDNLPKERMLELAKQFNTTLDQVELKKQEYILWVQRKGVTGQDMALSVEAFLLRAKTDGRLKEKEKTLFDQLMEAHEKGQLKEKNYVA